MSTEPYRCEACKVATTFVAAAKYPEDDADEATYGVTWRCPECGELSLDLCPKGPSEPDARSCLNCGGSRDPKKKCPDCGMTEAESLAFLRISDAKVRTLTNAERAFDEGLFRHGFAVVDFLLRKSPKDADLWKAKATQLQILKLPRAAASAYARCLAAKADPHVSIALAVARADAGDVDGALAVYADLVDDADPEVSAIAHANRGNVRESKDDVEGAETDYEAAIAKEPSRVTHYQNLARLFARRKRWREALGVVMRGLDAVDERDAVVLSLEKARAENELEDAETALATAEAILAKDPECARAHYHRAWALGLSGRLDEAKEALETMLDLEPTSKDGKRALEKIEAARAKARTKKPWWKIW